MMFYARQKKTGLESMNNELLVMGELLVIRPTLRFEPRGFRVASE